jgi:glyoxylase-like metal-dependent hydrolase (beta-lactamase superfamily II)
MERSSIAIGRVWVTTLWDGGPEADTPVRLSDAFPAVSPERWAPYRARFPQCFPSPETWVADFNPALVRTPDRIVLVDAGLGPSAGDAGRARGGLLASLANQGVRPEEVDLVVLTHLHLDHVGWLVTADGTPTFRRARHVVSQTEWEFVQRPDIRAADGMSLADAVAPLAERGVLDLLPGEAALTDELLAIPTPGHTPGHLSLLVDSDGQRGLLLGDVAHHPAQVSEPDWNTVWDTDPVTAAATRARVLEWAERERMIVVSYHFPAPGFGRVVEQGGRPVWEALGAAPG